MIIKCTAEQIKELTEEQCEKHQCERRDDCFILMALNYEIPSRFIEIKGGKIKCKFLQFIKTHVG
jgi:hypothetical protein